MAGPLIPLNPDLPVSYQVPGVYGYISLLGSGPTAQNRRVLFLMYKTSAGSWPANVLIKANNEEEVTQGTGKGSDCVRAFRAFLSQGGTGAETWFCPMNAPSGTAQTRTIKILAAAQNATTLGVNTSAQSAGIVTAWICGYRADAIVAAGDTFATIAANLKAEIAKFEDFLPCTVGVSTDTITLTGRHAALTSADLPIIVTFSNTSMGVAASPGILTVANNATADGSAIIGITTQTATAAVANGDTAAAIARNINSAVNTADKFPITSCNPTGAVCTLFFVSDRVFNWNRAEITAGITTTLTPTWGAAAAGLPSFSSPSLSSALTSIQGASDVGGAFKLWVTNLQGLGSVITDAAFTQAGSVTDYSVMGTISTFIESQGNGKNCKGQGVILYDTRSLATSGALQTSTTPALTASPRYFPSLTPACPQQAYEMGARVAALIISQDYLPKNYAGAILTSDGKVPLLGVHSAVSMSDSDANSAMLSYFMTPIRMNASGQYAIVSGRTSAKPGAAIDVRYVFWGQILTVDYFRDDMRQRLWAECKGKSIKPNGTPVTANTTTPEAIIDFSHDILASWDGLDYYDGAEALRDYLKGAVNPILPSRIDLAIPVRVPVPLEQISLYFQNVA